MRTLLLIASLALGLGLPVASHAQTIAVQKQGLTYSFSYQGKTLSRQQLEAFLTNHAASRRLYGQSRNLQAASGSLALGGAFLVFWSFERLLATSDPYRWPAAAIGLTMMGTSIPLWKSSQLRLSESVERYNAYQSSTETGGLYFYQQGGNVGLAWRF